jgi:hypothetical protein
MSDVDIVLLVDDESKWMEQVSRVKEICMKTGLGFRMLRLGDPAFDESGVLNELRSIPPQKRGRIRSGRGRVLPISHGGRLNLVNTPVALLRENGRITDVYPKELEGRTYSLFDFANKEERSGSSEQLLVEMLKRKPELLEPDWLSVKVEVDMGGGRADLMIESRNHTTLVECKNVADQEALGQLLKQASGTSFPRLVLLCMDVKGNILEACKKNGVEVYRLALERL